MTTLNDLVSVVDDGDLVAFGGETLHRLPMGFVRELVRQGHTDLSVVCVATSMDVDLLCGTGAASTIHFGYVGFEYLGLAPNFRRGVEEGAVEPHEGSCYTVVSMFRGGAQGLSHQPVTGLDGSDLPDVVEDFQVATCPFTGETTYAVRSARPDVAVLHANEADREGNARFEGGDLSEHLVAEAADQVFVTAEHVIDGAAFQTDPAATDIPAVLVDEVVEVPWGAHPTSCAGAYPHDHDHLRTYLERSRKGDLQGYVDEYLGASEAEYRDQVINSDASRLEWEPSSGAPDDDFSDPFPDREVTPAETICAVFARKLTGKAVAGQGFASPLPAVAIRLARELDPRLTHVGASGGQNAAPDRLWISSQDARNARSATAEFTEADAFDLAARGDLDVFFIGSAQIDRWGDLNGSVIGDWDDPKLRLGGGGGSASLLPLVEEVFAWRTEHSPRTFPETVDFTTASGSLSCVVTPLCVFERVEGELVVDSIHQGASKKDVQENTGWDVTFDDPGRTPPPTDEELALLETVDPTRTRRFGFRHD